MALGSSAPEILLSVIETLNNLGQCPGELGASCIVGSAAFNLMMISAFSVYAVSEENDTNEDRDETVPVGVKKINDMGVFTITCFFGIFAYVWIWLVLRDSLVSPTEAWLTLFFFFLLIGMAFAADKYNRIKQEAEALAKGEKEENKPMIEYAAVEIYRELISEKNGETAKTKEEAEKREKMKAFIKQTMNTD